jgi:alpha-beta hydrolase superfamily lysophospholipase
LDGVVTINGLPAHPLVVHAAVVCAPLAGLVALGYLVPAWRGRLRWWVLVLGVLAALLVWFASFTGGKLEDSLHQVMASSPQIAHAIRHHEDLAGKLQASTWVLGALSLIAWWLHPRPGLLRTVVAVLLAVCGIAVIVLCVLTGDAGAKAVWMGTPS